MVNGPLPIMIVINRYQKSIIFVSLISCLLCSHPQKCWARWRSHARSLQHRCQWQPVSPGWCPGCFLAQWRRRQGQRTAGSCRSCPAPLPEPWRRFHGEMLNERSMERCRMNIPWRDVEWTIHGKVKNERYTELQRCRMDIPWKDGEWTLHGEMENKHSTERWRMNIP